MSISLPWVSNEIGPDLIGRQMSFVCVPFCLDYQARVVAWG